MSAALLLAPLTLAAPQEGLDAATYERWRDHVLPTAWVMNGHPEGCT